MPTTVKKISINPKFNDKISPKRSSIDGYSTNYSSYRPAHPEKQGIGQTILPAPLRHPKPCMDSLIGQSRQPTLTMLDLECAPNHSSAMTALAYMILARD